MQPCPGPRPTTRTPVMEVPALSCDCHAHVIGPVAEFPFVEDRSFTPPDAVSTAYRAMLDALGVQRSVIVQPSVYGADNRRTVTAVAEMGIERCRGVAMVPPDVARDELDALDAGGIRATRFIATARGGPSLEALPAVARAVAPLGWHVEMYVPWQLWPSLLPVIRTLAVPVVFDHMAGLPADTDPEDPVLSEILELLAAGRAWVKLTGYRNSRAGHPYADVAWLAERFIEAAPGRCVWGSDWPHTVMPNYMPDDGDLFDLLQDWVPDPSTRHRVLVRNPAELYRF